MLSFPVNENSKRIWTEFFYRSSPFRRRLLPAALGGFFLLCGSPTFASGVAAREPALAEQLFAEGKKAMALGNSAAACAAFTASQAADPSVGALLNVARCHEESGKTATAWAEYRAAAALANQRGEDERRRGAQEHADQLERRLSRLSVEVASQVPDVLVRIDSHALASMSFGTGLPMDPGEHLIEAEARGYLPWFQRVPIAADGSTTAVMVPPLKEGTMGAEAWNGKRVAGVVVGSIGAASMAVGVVQAVRAFLMDRGLEKSCSPANAQGERICGAAEASQLDDLRLTANSATAILASGGGLAVVGIVLTFAGRTQDAEKQPYSGRSTGLRPVLTASMVGFSLVGSF